MVSFFNEATQNKLQTLLELFNLKFEAADISSRFKFKLDKVFDRLRSLKTDLNDLQVIYFLFSLPSKYQSIVNSIATQKAELTLAEVAKQVSSFEQRAEMQSNQ